MMNSYQKYNQILKNIDKRVHSRLSSFNAFRINSKIVAEKVRQTIGVCRYVYNLYLTRNKEHYEKEKKFMTGYDFSKWLNNVYTKEKDQWIKEVSSKAVKQSIMNGEKAFKWFFKGLSKFPKFKKKKIKI